MDTSVEIHLCVTGRNKAYTPYTTKPSLFLFTSLPFFTLLRQIFPSSLQNISKLHRETVVAWSYEQLHTRVVIIPHLSSSTTLQKQV